MAGHVISISMVFALAVGCTEVATAYIRIVAHEDNSKVVHSLRVKLEKLGWTKDEGVSDPDDSSITYRHVSLRGYFFNISHAEEKVFKIAFVGVGTHYFECDAIDAYKSLVALLQADPVNEVKYDVVTSSGQWIGDSGIAPKN